MQPCPFELKHLGAWRYAAMDATLSDGARTNLMTYLLAEVCTLCWGGGQTSGPVSAKRLEELGVVILEWMRWLPPTFQPLEQRYDEGDDFPKIDFWASTHCEFGEPRFW